MKRALLVALAACSGPSIDGTTCKDDHDCNLFDVQGTCEATGYCSYPDTTCTDGRRYAPAAGDGLANTCIGGPIECGGLGQTCCGTTCGANLVCEGETCTCGALDQPCCDGATCAEGVCDATATCTAPATFLRVALGMAHVCALRSDHTVWCWGHDWKPYPTGTPGLAVPVIDGSMPFQIAGLTDVEDIRGGEFHTCARKSDKTLWCWGHNEGGQLGNGTFVSSLAPVQVAGLSAVSQFDAGRHHTCALGTVDGTSGLYCWGRGGTGGRGVGTTLDPNVGLLGNNDNVDQPTPVAVDLSAASASGQTVTAFSAGAYHSCVVMSDNTIWCWGRNDGGLALGTGTASGPTLAPVKVDLSALAPAIPVDATIDQVSCSDSPRAKAGPSTCLRLSTGAIYCWGSGKLGQFGDGTSGPMTPNRLHPTTQVVPAASFAEVASAGDTNCARDTEGYVYCWGSNANGNVGMPLTMDLNATSPHRVDGLSGVTQIEASHRTACAIDDANRLWCWGNNRRSQVTTSVPTATDLRVFAPRQIVTP